MTLEIDVLRALLRLARRRTAPTLEQLLVRVDADQDALERALAALVRADLVHHTPKGPRLTLTGFAIAVAYAQRPAAQVSAPAPARAAARPRKSGERSRRRAA